MSLVFESIPSQGDVQQQVIGSEGLQVTAVAGMTYRIVDNTNPGGTIAARVRKVGDDMVIDLPDSGQTVVIQDYYFVCRFDYRSCVLQLDSHGGQAGSVISAEQLPSERLSDGSLLVWETGTAVAAVPVNASSQGAPAAVGSPVAQSEPALARGPDPIESRGGSTTKWTLVGGLGLGVLALAGGGSDGPAVASDSADSDNGAGNANGGSTDSGDSTDNGGSTDNGDSTDSGGATDNGDSTDNGGSTDSGDGTDNGGSTDSGDSTDNGGSTDSGDSTDNGGSTDSGDSTDNGGSSDNGGTDPGDTADTTAPDAPVLAIVAGDDVVSPAEQQSVVVISGTAEAGSTVQVSLGNLVQTTTTDVDGRFVLSVAPQDLPEAGSYLLSAVATDEAGNTSTVASRSVVIEADTDPSDDDQDNNSDQVVAIDRIVDDIARFTGELSDGDITNDNALLISGTLDEPLAAGQRVELLNAGNVLGVAETNGAAWQFETDALADGEVSLGVRVVDASGTVVATGDESFVLTIDTDAPRRPQFQPVEQNSVVDEDEIVDGVQLEGSGEAGATIEATWLDAQISGLVDENGDWTLTFDELPEGVAYGANSISVVQVDQAGNESTARVRNIWLELPDLLGNDDSLFASSSQDVTQSSGSTGFAGENGGNALLDDLSAGLNNTA